MHLVILTGDEKLLFRRLFHCFTNSPIYKLCSALDIIGSKDRRDHRNAVRLCLHDLRYISVSYATKAKNRYPNMFFDDPDCLNSERLAIFHLGWRNEDRAECD